MAYLAWQTLENSVMDKISEPEMYENVYCTPRSKSNTLRKSQNLAYNFIFSTVAILAVAFYIVKCLRGIKPDQINRSTRRLAAAQCGDPEPETPGETCPQGPAADVSSGIIEVPKAPIIMPDDKFAVNVENKFGDVSAISMRGTRDADEDVLLVAATLEGRPTTHIQALFDGHGGREISKFCAENLTGHIKPEEIDTGDCFTNAFLSLDEALPEDDAEFAGSTAVAIVLQPVEKAVNWKVVGRNIVSEYGDGISKFSLWWKGIQPRKSILSIPKKEAEKYYTVELGNLGDSTLYIFTEDGDLFRCTEDHKPDRETEKARIQAAGGRISRIQGTYRIDESLAASRAFGDSSYKYGSTDPKKTVITACPDVKKIYVKAGDIMILACDGLDEGLEFDTIKRVLRRNCSAPAEEINMLLIEEAFAKKSRDNISTILTKVRKYDPSRPTTYQYLSLNAQRDVINRPEKRVVITEKKQFSTEKVLLFENK